MYNNVLSNEALNEINYIHLYNLAIALQPMVDCLAEKETLLKREFIAWNNRAMSIEKEGSASIEEMDAINDKVDRLFDAYDTMHDAHESLAELFEAIDTSSALFAMIKHALELADNALN